VTVSVHKNPHGPLWPLGNIQVPTPGTPVSVMSLVDLANVNAPESATSTTSDEYTRRAQQIIFEAFRPGAAPPRSGANTGNIYIVLKSVGAGGANDIGTVIKTLAPGASFVLGSAALDRNVFNLYQIFIDADTANDGCTVTAVIQ
jgi:hypothetical protein